MIDRSCPNCSERVTFSYFSLFIMPRGPSRYGRNNGPILPGARCESCGEMIAMPTWWMFVAFLAALAVAYLFYTHAGGTNPQRNEFFALIAFILFQSVANALYVALGGRLEILA